MQYVVSDLHLDHDNIIEYCDRPFDSVEEMNRALVDRWNAVVEPDDEVILVGDLTISSNAGTFIDWIDALAGEIVLVTGNHDDVVVPNLDGLHVFDHYQFEHGEYRFYCVHDPADARTNWSGWTIHGHHHNNYPDRFPFVDPDRRFVNVSVELLDYAPLSVEVLCSILDDGERVGVLSSG